MTALRPTTRGRLLLAAMQLSLVVLILACSSVKPCACSQADDIASASSTQLRVWHPSSSSADRVPGQRRELLREQVVPKAQESEGAQASPTAATTAQPVHSPVPSHPALNYTQKLIELRKRAKQSQADAMKSQAEAERLRLELEKSLNQTQNDNSTQWLLNQTKALENEMLATRANIDRQMAKTHSDSSGAPGFKASTTAALQAAGLVVFFLSFAV